jgi:hypothetical protein
VLTDVTPLVLPNLAWARREVLCLLRELLVLDDDAQGRAVDRICALSRQVDDHGRRLALLVQMSAAIIATVAIAEHRPLDFDRDALPDQLSGMIQAALVDPAQLN